jgi:hypothetical protein
VEAALRGPQSRLRKRQIRAEPLKLEITLLSFQSSLFISLLFRFINALEALLSFGFMQLQNPQASLAS